MKFHSDYYESKDFPPLPQWIEDKVYEVDTTDNSKWLNPQTPEYADRLLARTDGTTAQAQLFKRYNVGDDVRQWALKNISDKIVDCGMSITTDFQNRNIVGPHADKTRKYTLLYVLDQGGPNVETVWWQEQGFPIVRERGEASLDYTKMRKLDSLVIPQRHWILIHSSVMHSVENLQHQRIAFQASFNEKI
jgi:hypothetical protein